MNAPKVGDRVRVVLEGEVQGVNPGGEFELSTGNYIQPYVGGVSIEKITPLLPTTPGSVVSVDGDFAVLTRMQGWIWIQTGGKLFNGTPDRYDLPFTVVFDAGAE